MVVADEGRRGGRARVETDRDLLRGGAGAAPLLLQQLPEPVAVDREPGLRGELFGELQREPEGVGELEGVFAGDAVVLGPASSRPRTSTNPWRSVAANRSSSDPDTCRMNASFSRSSG